MLLLIPIKLHHPINDCMVAVTDVWVTVIRENSYLLHVPEEKYLTDTKMWVSGFSVVKYISQL